MYTLILLLIINFFLEIWPRLINRYFGTDSWYYLSLANYMRRGKKFLDLGSIVKPESKVDVPPIVIYLMYYLPEKWIEKNQFIVSPIIDIVNKLILFFITFFITNNIPISILAVTMYIFTPLTSLETSSLSLRTVGAFFFHLAFLCILAYTVYPSILLIILSIIFICILSLTHKMSNQILLILCILFTIFEGHWIYLSVFFMGIILAIIVSKGYFFQMTAGQWDGIKFWWRNNSYKHYHQIRGKKIEKQIDFSRIVYFLTNQIPLLPLILTNLWILIICYFWLIPGNSINFNQLIQSNIILNKLFLWTMSLFIASILISNIKYLKCIGEGFRYLEYNAFPISILSAVILFNLYKTNVILPGVILIIGVIISAIIILLLQKKLVVNNVTHSLSEPLKEVIDKLLSINKKKNYLPIPKSLGAIIHYYILDHHNIMQSMFHYEMKKIEDFIPYFKIPVMDLIKKRNINLLIILKPFTTLEELKLKNYKIILENEKFYLIEFKR